MAVELTSEHCNHWLIATLSCPTDRQGWGGEGKELWEEHYAQPYNALNLGIGGDEVQHVTWRVQHGEVDAIKPECAVILIGTNNIGNVGHTAEPVAAGVRLLLDELRARCCAQPHSCAMHRSFAHSPVYCCSRTPVQPR